MALISLLALLPATATAGPATGGFQGDPQAIAEVQAAYQKFGAARTYRSRMTSTASTSTRRSRSIRPASAVSHTFDPRVRCREMNSVRTELGQGD